MVKKSFLPTLNAAALAMRPYIEPFCGSASIGRWIERKSGYVFSDLDPSLMCLLHALQAGTFETHPHVCKAMKREVFQQILRETADDVKTDKTLPVIVKDADLYARLLDRGIACFVYGHFQNPLGFLERDRCDYEEQINDFKRLAASPAFKACKLRRCSYAAYSDEQGAVIFVDPPYKDCHDYPINKHAPFCHNTFWQWFRDVSIDNCAYCSEMSAPRDMFPVVAYTASGRREFIFVAPNSLAHKLYLELCVPQPQPVRIKFPSSSYQVSSSSRAAGKRAEGMADADSRRVRSRPETTDSTAEPETPFSNIADGSPTLLDAIRRRLKDGVEFFILQPESPPSIYTTKEVLPGGVDAYLEQHDLFVSGKFKCQGKSTLVADASLAERRSGSSSNVRNEDQSLYPTQCTQLGYTLVKPKTSNREVFMKMPESLAGSIQAYNEDWPQPGGDQASLVQSLSIDLAKVDYWPDYQFTVDSTSFTPRQAIDFAVKIAGNAVVPALVTEIAKYANQFSPVHSIIDGFCSGGTVAYGFAQLLSLKQAFGIDSDPQVLRSFTHNLTRVCGTGGVGEYCGPMPTTFDGVQQVLAEASWTFSFVGTHLHLSPPCPSGVVGKKENQDKLEPYLDILEAFANRGATVTMEEGKNFKDQFVRWLGGSTQRSEKFYLYMICASDCGLLTRRVRCILTNFAMPKFDRLRVDTPTPSAPLQLRSSAAPSTPLIDFKLAAYIAEVTAASTESLIAIGKWQDHYLEKDEGITWRSLFRPPSSERMTLAHWTALLDCIMKPGGGIAILICTGTVEEYVNPDDHTAILDLLAARLPGSSLIALNIGEFTNASSESIQRLVDAIPRSNLGHLFFKDPVGSVGAGSESAVKTLARTYLRQNRGDGASGKPVYFRQLARDEVWKLDGANCWFNWGSSGALAWRRMMHSSGSDGATSDEVEPMVTDESAPTEAPSSVPSSSASADDSEPGEKYPALLSEQNGKFTTVSTAKTLRDGVRGTMITSMCSSKIITVTDEKISSVRGPGSSTETPKFVRELRAVDASGDTHKEFGVTTFRPDSPPAVLVELEKEMRKYLPVANMSEKEYKEKVAALGITGDKTVDCLPGWRTKLFFGRFYGYGGGHSSKHGMCPVTPLAAGETCPSCKYKHEVLPEVHPFDQMPAAFAAAAAWLQEHFAPPGTVHNTALVNMYARSGIGLKSHYDSPHLFKPPIISVRLFNDAALWFTLGGSGQAGYSDDVPPLAKIEQKRYDVTIMSGFAARGPMHQVQVSKDAMPVASFLSRTMHPELLDE